MKAHPPLPASILAPLLAAGLVLAWPCNPGLAQELPPAATPPAATAPARPHVKAHHARRRHRASLAPATPARLAPPPPQTAAAAGTTPAPMPNEDIGPPRAPADTSASVDPGNLSIHYPPLGQGYLPGSSSQDMANSQTPKVPGLTVNVPLQRAQPQNLPPPDAH